MVVDLDQTETALSAMQNAQIGAALQSSAGNTRLEVEREENVHLETPHPVKLYM